MNETEQILALLQRGDEIMARHYAHTARLLEIQMWAIGIVFALALIAIPVIHNERRLAAWFNRLRMRIGDALDPKIFG